jgi:ketosteroid isomerase-like protein
MSQENVQLVQRALGAWAEVDSGHAGPERLAEFFASDVVWDMGPFSGWLEREELRGTAEFLAFRDSWTAAYDEWSYGAEDIVDGGGDRVVATMNQRGKLAGSDSWVGLRYGIVYTVEAGLIRHAAVYASPEEALEAVGLSE